MKIQCAKKLFWCIDFLGILAIWGLFLECFWDPKCEQNINFLIVFVIWASFGRLWVTWGSFWGPLRNFWRHFVRLGVRNGVSKRLLGELVRDARAKNTRVRASKHEITIFLTLVTMHDNIFVFGANFLRFWVIWGDFWTPFGAQNPSQISFCSQEL